MVLSVMKRFGIVGVPVFRDGGEGKEYMGMVSIHDILAYTVFQKLFDKIELEKTTHVYSRWLDIDQETKSFFQTPISNLLGTTLESNLTCRHSKSTKPGLLTWKLKESDSLESLMKRLTLFHRVLVVGEEEVKVEEVGGETLREAQGEGESTGIVRGQRITMVTQVSVFGEWPFLGCRKEIKREDLGRI
ncbi:hypothetical protein HDU67_007092 [Dinochytrium kinnereticum]|nr:hypothetical protein HDU67_007092 [Dinochytrium kinnereticum]